MKFKTRETMETIIDREWIDAAANARTMEEALNLYIDAHHDKGAQWQRQKQMDLKGETDGNVKPIRGDG